MGEPVATREVLNRMLPALSVGIISADLMRLAAEVELLAAAGVGLLHFDVMDGCFVPALTVGPGFVKGVRGPLLKDVHLMIQRSDDQIAAYAAAGADIITIHPEGCSNPLATLGAIGHQENRNPGRVGILRGMALLPDTPLEVVAPLWEVTDVVTILAVEPRANRPQPTAAQNAERVAAVREVVARLPVPPLTLLDGGVKLDNFAALAGLGVDLLVSGSAVFNGDSRANLEQMQLILRGLGGAGPPNGSGQRPGCGC